MRPKFPPLLALCFTLGALLWPGAVPRAHAANAVVSDCGDNGGANQLRAKMNEIKAIGEGGTITFSCGPTVLLTGGELPGISDNILVNGGNTVTLSGNNASRLFFVNSGGMLTLNNITITKGFASGDGGAIRNEGILNLTNAKLIDNHVTNGSGGAIFSRGAINITNSEFANNSATNGGALYLKWGNADALIQGSNFHDNATDSLITGWGGAVLAFDGGWATIGTTTFRNNKAGYGGALFNYYGTLQLYENCLLTGNEGLGYGGGGAIYSEADPSVIPTNLLLDHATLSGNKSSENGGGAIHNKLGKLWLKDVTLDNNTSLGDGGGIFLQDGSMTLTNVTLSGNTATGNGGGIKSNGGIDATLTNVTLSSNSAGGDGGGIDNFNSLVSLANVTLSGNTAPGTGGIHNKNTTITLKNTLVAKGTSGTNCSNEATALTYAFNLSNDNSCGFGAGRDSVNLLLGPLANNGGFTKTHLPSANPKSPAIDNGTGNGCTATDQRGLARPQGLACDVGSVEVQPATPTPTRTVTHTPTRTPTVTQTPANNCLSKPAKPTLKAPADSAVSTSDRPLLKWNAAACAQTYQVVVKDAATGAKRDKAKGLTGLKYKTDALPAHRTYKWVVKACNNSGCVKSVARRLMVQ